MAMSSTTRTHLIYQFIILTVLFLSIGYNELLPDRKFILFLAFVPIFCYQLVILSCCMELISVPRWMSFLQSENTECIPAQKEFKFHSETIPFGPISISSQTQTVKELTFPDASEIPPQRRWEKSVTNLGASAKCFTHPQKSKSWMSLNDSKSAERLLSREGSLDVLTPLSNRKCSSSIMNKPDKTRNREERATKAKSWKPCETDFVTSDKAELAKSISLSTERSEPPLLNCMTSDPHEESELSKSYSFPFRQKRLETWLERKETATEGSNQSLDMPYWHSVGYNLAVKYEARRRQRTTINPAKSELHNEESAQIVDKRQEVPTDYVHLEKHNSKKCAKLAAARINKIKVGFSNLISKRKDEMSENCSANLNKVGKCNLLLKLKNKSTPCPTKEKQINMPDFPQFLNNDRPLIFYPRYLPFEKERFENDVRKKIKELADEQKT